GGAVGGVAARGEEEHGRPAARLAQPAQQREAVEARQHRVEEDQVVAALGRVLEAGAAVRAGVDDEAAQREAPCHELLRGGIVLDVENPHPGRPSRGAPRGRRVARRPPRGRRAGGFMVASSFARSAALRRPGGAGPRSRGSRDRVAARGGRPPRSRGSTIAPAAWISGSRSAWSRSRWYQGTRGYTGCPM